MKKIAKLTKQDVLAQNNNATAKIADNLAEVVASLASREASFSVKMLVDRALIASLEQRAEGRRLKDRVQFNRNQDALIKLLGESQANFESYRTRVKVVIAELQALLEESLEDDRASLVPGDLFNSSEMESEMGTELNTDEDRLFGLNLRLDDPDLCVSTRFINAMRGIGVVYVGDLVRYTKEELKDMKLKDLGDKHIEKEVSMISEVLGISLGSNVEGWVHPA